jgi:stage IV sporulation protein FB
MARVLKIRTSRIILTPLGIMAKIEYSNIEFLKEFLIAVLGPLSNFLMAAAGYYINSYFGDNSSYMSFFILCNISLGLLNLLPVLPLDGGRIVKNVLLKKCGYNIASKVFSTVSKVTAIFLVIAGLYQFLNTWYNLSLISIGIFIYLSIYKERQYMLNESLMLLLRRKSEFLKKGIYEIEYIAASEEKTGIEILKSFRSNKYYIIKVFDNNMKQIGEICETELIKSIIENFYYITLKEIIRNNDIN